jgi:hypothetical protein
LHDIDLARIAPRALELQRKQLEQIRHGRPPFSYNPLRGCFHDIFNVVPEMFGPVAPSEWSAVECRLRYKCKTEDELKANLLVARGLHQFAVEAQMLGRAQEFFPLAMSAGQKVNYWLPIVLSLDGKPLVPFIDPRRSSRGLTQDARRFVFSMMHERIRVADPDYESVALAIFQFDDGDGERRSPKLYTDEGVELFSLDEMEAMVATTYNLWRDVCEGREIEARRAAAGSRGPLGL